MRYVAHACAKEGAIEAAYHLSRLQQKCGRTKFITAGTGVGELGEPRGEPQEKQDLEVDGYIVILSEGLKDSCRFTSSALATACD